jgi:cytochrome c556
MGTKKMARGSGLAIAMSACVVAVAAFVSISASAQNDRTGLTGGDRTDDVIMARQLLMEGMEEDMMVVELTVEGKDFKLPDLQARAYNMNRLLTAFPHLFPPQTRPPTDGSPSPTAASPAVWENFDDFYGKVMASAMTAFEAGQAEDADKFKEKVKVLRAQCDTCHAQYMKVEAPSPP